MFRFLKNISLENRCLPFWIFSFSKPNCTMSPAFTGRLLKTRKKIVLMILFGFEVRSFNQRLNLQLSFCQGWCAGDRVQGAARSYRPRLHCRGHRHPQGGERSDSSLTLYVITFVSLLYCNEQMFSLFFLLLISKGLNSITYPTISPPDSEAFDVGEVEVHREVQICQQVQGERKTLDHKCS